MIMIILLFLIIQIICVDSKIHRISKPFFRAKITTSDRKESSKKQNKEIILSEQNKTNTSQ